MKTPNQFQIDMRKFRSHPSAKHLIAARKSLFRHGSKLSGAATRELKRLFQRLNAETVVVA